ncbi:glycoside hydrolase family 16 protein [Myxococcus sp. 1LA]
MMLQRLLPVALALTGLACDPAANRVNRPNNPNPSTPQPSTDWELVWQDEFDGEAGTPPSPERWVHDVGGHGWGNEQLEFNTDRTENTAHDGAGNLVITARRERYGNREYTSGRIRTQGRYEPTFGRIEARIQLPVGRGIWPAFWMLGANIASVDWPECGEIDIMEYRGQLPSILRGSLHGPGYSAGNNIGQEHVVSGKRLNEGFHIYAVEWEPDRIRWFLDDTMYMEVTPSRLPEGARWVFNAPQFIILNVAVGGTFVGPVGRDTVFPQEMKVDYVRVYARPT